MKEGLEFLTPEHGIMEYGYDPFYEEEPDFLPMYLSKQIRVIYNCTDMITEYLTDYYNSYSQETYDIIPVTTCDLSPKRRNCSAWTTIRNVSSNGRKNSSTSQYKPIWKAYDRQQRTDQKNQDAAQPQGGTDCLCLGE